VSPTAPASRLDGPLRGIAFVLVGASVSPLQDVVILWVMHHQAGIERERGRRDDRH
jgi:hypothetical protein